MTLHRLAVRTKKSLSGLYSFQTESTQVSSSPGTSATKQTTPPKAASTAVEEFGLLRSDGDASPGRDSPSRRHRLLGSLRSMKSLQTLRSKQNSSKKSEDEPPARTEAPQTPVKETPSVSLNFEASPANVPMFGPMTRTNSCSSSLRVHHSSPITVPLPSHETTPISSGTPSGLGTFPTGTVPDTPAPLQIVSVQEAIISNAGKGSPFPAFPDDDLEIEPLPTPMPGTNLPLEEMAAPGIMITSPSAPSMQGHDALGYFDSLLVPDENDYERTKTLDTESGFPTFDEIGNSAVEDRIPDLVDAIVPAHATIPEVEPASFDQSFPVEPLVDSLASSASKSPCGSNDYGDGVAYIVYDGASGAEQERKRCPGHWGRLTSQCSDHPRYDGKGYGRREATSSSHYWTDSTEPTSTDSTEFTQYTSHEETAAEDKLRAAIEELDAATLAARPQWPGDDKKALQDMIRAYAHLGEGRDDVRRGVLLAEGAECIRQEIKDEVETSIRVMNRSLGG
ncbi:hypothetical protein PMIN06_009482 [Paraphaeosphaeria minitans]|uniref:Uncharacterized protein n=1 Tax=Paraphaeosphaeria minitans TaxID=565426 RepID=A0A9P6GU62_9PLEO|nr:hypothetical protein PMIN01_02919 [Paraphaeosphaeria minitans]